MDADARPELLLVQVALSPPQGRAAWRKTVAPSVPEVSSDAFDGALARAVIAWSWLSVTFLMPHARTDTDPDADRKGVAVPAPPRPDPQTLIVHRLRLAAEYPTRELPALRDLAGRLHDACSRLWGQRQLELAPAFRSAPSDDAERAA